VEQLLVAEVLHDVGLALERRRVAAGLTDVEVLRPEAGDDLSNALTDSASRRGSGTVQSPAPTSFALSPEPSRFTSMKFIDGLPMKPATKRLAGESYSVCGVPTCMSSPSLMTAIRVPIVMASIWSWVT
jgi:hypothetical protein